MVGDNIAYYAVDHSPSYLWNSATWENSEAILPFLDVVLAGPAGWDSSDTIRRANEIRDGVVQNPADPRFPAPIGALPARPQVTAGPGISLRAAWARPGSAWDRGVPR